MKSVFVVRLEYHLWRDPPIELLLGQVCGANGREMRLISPCLRIFLPRLPMLFRTRPLLIRSPMVSERLDNVIHSVFEPLITGDAVHLARGHSVREQHAAEAFFDHLGTIVVDDHQMIYMRFVQQEWRDPVFSTSRYGSAGLRLISLSSMRGRLKAGAPQGAEATLATAQEAAYSAGVW